MKKMIRKLTLCFATFVLMFTSVFSNIATPVYAASETTFFEVNKADEVINEAKKVPGTLLPALSFRVHDRKAV